MEFLLNRFRNITVLLLVILAQLVLLAYQVKSNEDVRLIRVWSVTAVTPMAKVLEVVRANTIGIAENYFVLLNVREENRKLQEENGKLKMDNQFLRSELQTADRAVALKAFQTRTPSRTLPARIIGTGTGTNSRVVFIDQGSAAGVMRGMAVVTPDGIVGKVLGAYPTASQVSLITDPTFAAGVISDRHRVHGTVKGQGQSKCLVDYVENEEKVEVGEMFYTSGADRVFPKGMPVGRVSVVRQGRNFKEIFLVPSGYQNGLEEVLVVIEGVHQPIPDAETLPAPGLSMVPPPVDAPAPQGASGATGSTGSTGSTGAPANVSPALMTDADRLRERYKRIGEAQKHVFGEGAPGSKPPDFNMNPDAAKPQAPAASTPTTAAQAKPPASAQPKPPATATAKPPATASPKPAAATTKPATTAATKPPIVATTKPPITVTAPPPAATPKTTAPKPKGTGIFARPPAESALAAAESKPPAQTTREPITARPKPATAKPAPRSGDEPPTSTRPRPANTQSSSPAQ